jgi:hypothetical protein
MHDVTVRRSNLLDRLERQHPAAPMPSDEAAETQTEGQIQTHSLSSKRRSCRCRRRASMQSSRCPWGFVCLDTKQRCMTTSAGGGRLQPERPKLDLAS